MTRISAPQALIFSFIALAASLIGNGLLYLNISDATLMLDTQRKTIGQLTDQLNEQRELKSTQVERLDTMSGQQSELADIIVQLRDELDSLSRQQQLTADTAQQSQQQLQAARTRIDTLDQQLSATKEELTATEEELIQARITMNNQQRALRQLSTETVTDTGLSALSAELATRLSPVNADISINTAADGSALVNIPTSLVFRNTQLDYAEPGPAILSTLAEVLNRYPERQIQVIGHADARPIVSDLAQTYPTNWELSSARASRVVTFLINQGLADHRLLASGRAANQPVRDGANEQDWAINRRIEIQIR